MGAGELDQRRHCRRVPSARHPDEADIARYFGVDEGTHLNARDDGAELGDDADAEASRHHVLDPILALAGENDWRIGVAFIRDLGQLVAILAVDPAQIALAVDLADGDAVHAGEAMLLRKGDNKALAIEA